MQTMIIDGKRIAEEINTALRGKVTKAGKDIVLDVFVVGENYATEKFITLKKKVAESIGITVNFKRFERSVTSEALQEAVLESSKDEAVQGIIVQLSLPKHIDTKIILDSVRVTKDIDVLSSESRKQFENDTLDILPPVIGAIKEILERNHVELSGKHVVVIGKGSLVGKPAAIWFTNRGANVATVDQETNNIKEATQSADIIVSGAGVPDLITPDMIKEGVVLLDAGTSEQGGRLSGDADPACADKASIFTPVPGGIGPITISTLLRNLVERSIKE